MYQTLTKTHTFRGRGYAIDHGPLWPKLVKHKHIYATVIKYSTTEKI